VLTTTLLSLAAPAGKWGQLAHGDTSKRTVGRLVKQIRQLHVLQVGSGKTTQV